MCPIQSCPFAAYHVDPRDLRGARHAAPFGWCAAPGAGPCDSRADPDAAPSRPSGPQHLMLLGPRPAPQLVPKSRTLFDARSFAFQFFHSCSTSLVAAILAR
jgi:hypothetical protein